MNTAPNLMQPLSHDDARRVDLIVRRAFRLMCSPRDMSRRGLAIRICTVHKEERPLDLQQLLDCPDITFMMDIVAICGTKRERDIDPPVCAVAQGDVA